MIGDKTENGNQFNLSTILPSSLNFADGVTQSFQIFNFDLLIREN